MLADLADHGLAHDRLPTRHGRAPQIGVVVAMSTLAGLDEQPAELLGAGPITAPTARRIAAGGVWRRLLTDPAGQLLEISADTYEPPQALRDLVLARDRTCRGPGCRTPADRCDLDHTIPWPTGPTSPANLRALCRSHHRLKTHTDTTYRTDPLRRVYIGHSYGGLFGAYSLLTRTELFELIDSTPVSIARATRSARAPSRVQIEPESPYGVSFASRTASAPSISAPTPSKYAAACSSSTPVVPSPEVSPRTRRRTVLVAA